MARDRLLTVIIVAVLAVWVVSGFVSLYTSDVRVFLIATGPFSGILTYGLGFKITKKVNGDNGE